MEAEVSAFIGDRQWRSETKQTITVHYRFDTSKQRWEVNGLDVNNPVIPVKLRSDPA
ncbi:hypothetical protein EV294_101813 [Paenibacillus sp. BK033]|nr:hypothetical protein EV294_101813 [Paenibacillus sp. BK033]